jgi:DNA-binding response OmpR family regulator
MPVALIVFASDRARILAAGFQAHVPKPVEPRELVAAIAAVTQRQDASAT